jgi:hypothetical protein
VRARRLQSRRRDAGPHALFERHGAPHVDAVVHERDGVAPAEEKLGTFRLSGLRDVVLTSEPARVFAGFDPNDERYGKSCWPRSPSDPPDLQAKGWLRKGRPLSFWRGSAPTYVRH